MRIQPVLLAAALSFLAPSGPAAGDLSYYLPADTTYDPAVPQPSSVLGFEVGERHVRHDQLVYYLRTLAEHSDRVRIEVTGRTHENRELLLLTISTPANLARLDEIQRQHLALSDPALPLPSTAEMPLVAYLGYSIHGDEASGANASLVVAYHLAAARGEAIDALLGSTVILFDPCLNPDGFDRFAHWVNVHRGRVPVGDANHREHREGWPSGRGNHYWFDLNRDWLLAQQPESQARLETFHRWRPNVLTDHHEMGSEATYFFQPGVPTRQNPLTPERNLELTREIAAYHARALDRAGKLYFSEEIFDDFYYGKGSTYPDGAGAVGILFEQASAHGQLRDTSNGPLTFPFAIRNHVLTTFSTLAGALDRRQALLDYQAEFFRGVAEKVEESNLRAYVFGDPHDPARNHHLLELLAHHRIAVRELAAPLALGDESFEPGRAWVVPLDQPHYRLVRALFEERVDFADSTFYDVSTWTLPLAFGLPSAALDKKTFRPALLGDPVASAELPAGQLAGAESAYAYLFTWDGYYAPRALYRLLASEVRVRVATEPFTAQTDRGRRELDRGTIVVPLGIQDRPPEEIREVLAQIAANDGIDVFAAATGLTPEGVDLGSPRIRPLELPKPALVVGEGLRSTEAGALWHLLDHRFGIPLPLVERSDLGRFDLAAYTHLILVHGEYGNVPPDVVDKLRRWVRDGGTLIATKKAAVWAGEAIRGDPEPAAEPACPPSTESATPAPEKAAPERRPYTSYRDDFSAQIITGAIFTVELDTTHPLAYGYRRSTLPFFRNSRLVLPPAENPYVTVGRYAEEPLMSGYISAENLAQLRGSPALIAERIGRGTLIRMADDPNFRSVWYGTNKLLLNAIFFAQVIDDTSE